MSVRCEANAATYAPGDWPREDLAAVATASMLYLLHVKIHIILIAIAEHRADVRVLPMLFNLLY